MMEINIDELKGLQLKVPQGWLSQLSHQGVNSTGTQTQMVSETTGEKKVIRQLKKQYYQSKDVKIGTDTRIDNGNLTIDEGLIEGALETDKLIKKVTLDVIKPEDRHLYTDTIMDVCPIATKVEGKLGEGETRI